VDFGPHYMGAECELTPNDFSKPDKRFWYASSVEPYNNPIEGVVSPHRVLNKSRTVAPLSNGGKFYRDVNDHMEICTPETSNPDDVVTYILASEELVVRSVARYVSQHNEQNSGQEPSLIKIHRRLTTHSDPEKNDYKDMSCGFHENYYVHVPEGVERRDHAKKLVPFLMGRTVFTGAGQAGSDPDTGDAVFMPAQKARYLQEAESTVTTRAKPWVIVRDKGDDHNGKIEGYMRVQVAGGDANISPWATHFAFASTDIVLTLMDKDVDLGLEVLERKGHRDVREASQAVADNFRGDAKVKVIQDGETIEKTPIELLDHYMNLALDNLHLFSPRQKQFLQEDWKQASDDYHEDPMLLYDRADWICKQWLANRQGIKDIDSLQALDMYYDAMTGFKQKSGEAGPGLGWKLRKLGHFAYSVDWNAVERGLYHGPQDTRAFTRGEAIRLLRAVPERMLVERNADWGKLYYRTNVDLTQHKIYLSDPGGELDDEEREKLAMIKKLALDHGAENIVTCPDPSCDVCSGYRAQAELAKEAAA
jgi:hypothetical protein